MAKVRKPLIHHSRRSLWLRPSLTPSTGTKASRAAEAMAKRRATPVTGGMPRRPMRIAAQVVPQTRMRAARQDQVRARVGFSAASGIDLVEHPRVRDRLAEVRQAGHPGHEALDSHAEAAVRKGAVLPHVEVPLERLDWQVVLVDSREQQVVVVDPLAAADDLAVAFGGQQVEAEHNLRIF